MLIEPSNQKYFNAITIKCVCGCSYLEILDLSDGYYEFQLYQCSKLKHQKLINRFNQEFLLNKNDLEYFANQFDLSWYGQEHEGCRLNNYLIELKSAFNNFSKENNIYDLKFYKIKGRKQKLVFDICLDYSQVNKLYNNTKELIK